MEALPSLWIFCERLAQTLIWVCMYGYFRLGFALYTFISQLAMLHSRLMNHQQLFQTKFYNTYVYSWR